MQVRVSKCMSIGHEFDNHYMATWDCMFRNCLFRARAGSDTGRAKGSDPRAKFHPFLQMRLWGCFSKGLQDQHCRCRGLRSRYIGIGIIVTEYGLLLCQVASNPQCIS